MAPNKSDKWYLLRYKFGGQYFLNEGDTTIGRNKEADVITVSNICSRSHCIITLEPDDSIWITNKSSNGVYVNGEKIAVVDSKRQLKHGDIVGLGCEESIFNLIKPTDDIEKYFIFHLINRTVVDPGDGLVIDLVSDEEEDRKPIIKDEVFERINVKNVMPDQSISTASKLPTAGTSSSSPKNMSPIPDAVPNDDYHDENELIYSQQVLMEIKQEVNCPDENLPHDTDFSMIMDISDESGDEDSSSWANRLSQDQDRIVKKVSDIVNNGSSKRKGTKQIEAIPIVPMKKLRRNTGSATEHSVPIGGDKRRKSCDDRNQIVEPNTSKSSNKKSTNDKFRDQPVPSKTTVASKTNNGLKQSKFVRPEDVQPKKKRIAHVPKPINKLRSILRRNRCWPSEGYRKRFGLKVQFDTEAPIVHSYLPEQSEVDETAPPMIPSPVKSIQSNRKMNSFQNDPIHKIITEITEWKPHWISHKNTTPPINGVDLVIQPLIDKYPTFDAYAKTVNPLLKHELWASIQGETQTRNPFDVTINTMSLVKRADRRRYVFHLQVAVESANARGIAGNFVIVEDSKSPAFFAYVTEQRFTRSGYTTTTYLSMEASESVVKLRNGEATTLRLTPISNIRTELKLFNAVLNLDRSPLKEIILNPSSYREPNLPNLIPQFQYSGYEALNEQQTEILKSIYNKIVNGKINLSLIEGPPGTGKTRLIVSIILQLLFGIEMRKPLRILVLASSNAAVDIIAKRLLYIRGKIDKGEKKQNFMKIVRFGVLSSMCPEVRQIAPENLKLTQAMSPSPSSQNQGIKELLSQQKTIQQEIDALSKQRDAKNTVTQDMIKELERRSNQIREAIERQTNVSDDISEVMAKARVVCSTISSSINLKQYIGKFDVCFIDEASQCTEPWSLVPLQYNITSLILIGDSNQLSPVVLSPVCRQNNFARSLFARLYDAMSKNGTTNKNIHTMTTQYRMHPDICSFSNSYFYKKRLSSAPQTAIGSELRPYSVFSLACEQSNRDTVNYYNVGEAEFIVFMLKVMIKHANPKEHSYGIITPYAKQRAEIQHLLTKSQTLATFDIPVNTIDSYQGQEKDIIIFCTTRTNGVGFLANPQRLNVALTRAKKCLVICGNFKSISGMGVWKSLLNDAQLRKLYHEIPAKYNFQTIADLLVVKKAWQTKPRTIT